MNMRNEKIFEEGKRLAAEEDAREAVIANGFKKFNESPEMKKVWAEARAQAEAELDEDGLAKAREEVE
jgi:hypothetical protein